MRLLDLLPAEKLNVGRSLLDVIVEPLARVLALGPVEEERAVHRMKLCLPNCGETSGSFEMLGIYRCKPSVPGRDKMEK